jgi:hypothetical protein
MQGIKIAQSYQFDFSFSISACHTLSLLIERYTRMLSGPVCRIARVTKRTHSILRERSTAEGLSLVSTWEYVHIPLLTLFQFGKHRIIAMWE